MMAGDLSTSRNNVGTITVDELSPSTNNMITIILVCINLDAAISLLSVCCLVKPVYVAHTKAREEKMN